MRVQWTELEKTRTYIEDDAAAVMDRLVKSLVRPYTDDLSKFIERTRRAVENAYSLTDKELEALIIRIPAYCYFVAEGLEQLGVRGDIADGHRKEQYVQAYNKAEGAQLKRAAQAEVDTFSEQLLMQAYQRAYKQLKLQLEIAQTLGTAAKKIISKRMLETQSHLVDKGVKVRADDD